MEVSASSQACLTRGTGESGPLFSKVRLAVFRDAFNNDVWFAVSSGRRFLKFWKNIAKPVSDNIDRSFKKNACLSNKQH